MGTIISFLNIKGGVGKTASSIIIGHIMSQLHHKKVLLVDTDPQSNSSSMFSEQRMIDILQAYLFRTDLEVPEYSLVDVLSDVDFNPEDAIQKTKYDNLYILPSLPIINDVEEKLRADFKNPQQFRLKNQLDKIKDDYDYIVLDCSPAISLINTNALVASDKVYIPLRCDAWSGIGMAQAKTFLENIQSYSDTEFGGAFITQWEKKNVNKVCYEIISAFLQDKLIDIIIPKSKLVEEMSYQQLPLLEIDNKQKDSKVTEAYKKLVQYIIEH